LDAEPNRPNSARAKRKATKINVGATRWCRPASTTRAQAIIENMKPERPISISGLRPCRSEARAHQGEEAAHNSAESEKIAATIGSGMPIDRPIAGSTEIIPVLPMAVTRETPKMMAKVFLGRPSGAVAGLGMDPLLVRADPLCKHGKRTRGIKQ
jgi:hypothetical protein